MTFANVVAALNNYVAISSIKYVSNFEYFLVMIYNKKRRSAKLIADLGKRKRLITCSLVQAPQKLWLWVCVVPIFYFLNFFKMRSMTFANAVAALNNFVAALSNKVTDLRTPKIQPNRHIVLCTAPRFSFHKRLVLSHKTTSLLLQENNLIFFIHTNKSGYLFLFQFLHLN